MPQNNIGVVKIYDGLIPNMRREGNTLQQIGDRIGVTRERVRQILSAVYPQVNNEYLREAQVEELIGCGRGCLTTLRKKGILNPIHTNKFYLYDKDEIIKARQSVCMVCVVCGKQLGSHRHKYCLSCGKERERYSYPFLNDEQKQRHLQCTVKWQKNHREIVRKINQRASIKYRLKKKELLGMHNG